MNISVIMPTFNRAFCIEKAIDSVLQQDYLEGDIELIIVDDCSNDNTCEIVNRYLGEKVKYIKNNTNLGGAESRNIGVNLSSFDYVSFIDSDVVWYPNKLSQQVNVMHESQRKDAVIYCGYRKEKAIATDVWECLPDGYHKGNVKNAIIYHNFIDTPSLLLKKDHFCEVGGFDKELPRFQDWGLVIKLSGLRDFIPCEEVLYDSYSLPYSITSNDRARLKAIKIIFKKNIKYILAENKLKNRFYMKIINAHIKAGERVGLYLFAKSYKFEYKWLLISLVLSSLPISLYRVILNLVSK